jgi:hypothetical protein
MSPSRRFRTRTAPALAASGFAAWLAMAGCEGSATQTTTGKAIEGVLVDSHGDPVDGATVEAWPAAYGPSRGGMPRDSAQTVAVRTDASGHYAMTGLEAGVYNLFGADPSNRAAVLIPRVKYLEQAADLGIDTLKAPGAIVGLIRSAGGGQPPATFCYLEGSNYAVISDSAGRFVLPDLAEGRYRLNYFAIGYAGAVDSAVTVRSGDTTVLSPKTLGADLALQPPAPAGVSAIYDAVYGVVHLAWRPVRVGDFKEYLIETEDTPVNALPGPRSWTVVDTAFQDRTMTSLSLHNLGGGPFTRKYWVRTRDTEGNLSPKPGQPVSVRLTDPAIFRTEYAVRLLSDTAAANACLDTVAFALDVVSSPDSLVRIKWAGKGYYHDSGSAGGLERVSPKDSLGISIGAPRRDTLYLTRRTLDGLGASGPQVVWDSLVVSATIVPVGSIRSALFPVRMDSLGCFHPSPAMDR